MIHWTKHFTSPIAQFALHQIYDGASSFEDVCTGTEDRRYAVLEQELVILARNNPTDYNKYVIGPALLESLHQLWR